MPLVRLLERIRSNGVASAPGPPCNVSQLFHAVLPVPLVHLLGRIILIDLIDLLVLIDLMTLQVFLY